MNLATTTYVQDFAAGSVRVSIISLRIAILTRKPRSITRSIERTITKSANVTKTKDQQGHRHKMHDPERS